LPLIYNGQEADNDRQLAFFERDPIVWREGRHDALFRKLIALKTAHPALHNGRFGAAMVEVPTSAASDVFAFTRGTAGERVFAVFNLSPRPHSITFSQARHHGRYTDALSGAATQFTGGATLDLPAWGYRIYAETK
jgi:glycosidase